MDVDSLAGNAAGISMEGSPPVLLQGLHYGHKLLPGEQHSVHYGLLLAPVVRRLPPELRNGKLEKLMCMLVNSSLCERWAASLQVCITITLPIWHAAGGEQA